MISVYIIGEIRSDKKMCHYSNNKICNQQGPDVNTFIHLNNCLSSFKYGSLNVGDYIL